MRSGRRWLAIGLMVLGAAIAVPIAIVAGVHVQRDLKIEALHATPSSFQVRLGTGRWEVYELTATVKSVSAGALSFRRSSVQPLDIDAADIRVTDPAGEPLALRQTFSASSFETFSTGSRVYTGLASFEAASPGTYAVAVVTPRPDQVIVARPAPSLARGVGWLAAAAGGAAVLTVGLILFIVDLERRRRMRGPAWYPGQPGQPGPPGRPGETGGYPPYLSFSGSEGLGLGALRPDRVRRPGVRGLRVQVQVQVRVRPWIGFRLERGPGEEATSAPAASSGGRRSAAIRPGLQIPLRVLPAGVQ